MHLRLASLALLATATLAAAATAAPLLLVLIASGGPFYQLVGIAGATHDVAEMTTEGLVCTRFGRALVGHPVGVHGQHLLLFP